MRPFKVIKSKDGYVITDTRGKVFRGEHPYKTKKEAQDQADEWNKTLTERIWESFERIEKEFKKDDTCLSVEREGSILNTIMKRKAEQEKK